MTKDFKNKQNSDSPLNDVTSWILAGIALGLFIGLMVYIFSGKKAPENQSVAAINSSQGQYQSASMPASSPVAGDSSSKDLVSKDTASVDAKNSQSAISERNGNAASMAELDQIIEDNLDKGKDDNRPTFDYHVILPTLDVEVPVARPTEWRKDKPSRKESTKEKKKVKSEKPKADKVKKAIVEKITTPGNYIIQVGAYKKQAEANNMKKRVGSIANAYVEKATIKANTWYRVRIGPISDLNEVNRVRAQLSSKGIASFKKLVK